MSLSIRMKFEPQRTLAAGSIGAAYMGVGTALTNPARLILLQNLTDQTIQFSFDGINDHLPLPSAGYVIFDITANKSSQSQGFYMAEGDRLYVKELGTGPASGAVYFSVVYGDQ